MNFKVPSIATIIVGAVLTVIQALNVTTFHFGLPWSIGLAAILPALAAFGLGPLTGEKFQALIELTPAETTAVASLLGGLSMVVLKIEMSTGWHAALTAIIVAAAALGFGQNTISAVKQARYARRQKWA